MKLVVSLLDGISSEDLLDDEKAAVVICLLYSAEFLVLCSTVLYCVECYGT